MLMNRMLLIVDPQIDFISGAMPVAEASASMQRLAGYITAHDGDYIVKVVTADCHPYDHCSFVECGGPWPRHCVHDTVGAAVFQPVFDAVYSTDGRTVLLHKGTDVDTEEYSLFANRRASLEFEELLEAYAIDSIDVCGIAGDICVLSTLRDAMSRHPFITYRVLMQFCPSIDGGEALRAFINENNLTCDK